jgi:ubiquinone/menaquinone biosynthesis C-methylase UbiE
MGRMNRLVRWLANRQNAARSARLLKLVVPHLPLTSSSRVLELGAGVGGLSALLANEYRVRSVVATDYDPTQVEAARRHLTRKYGTLPAGLTLQQADALAIPFPDRSFDMVFAIGVLHHVEARHSEYLRRPQALAEICRVLTPGGSFVYTEFVRTDEVRRSLTELGFTPMVSTARFGHQELDIYRSPL